MKKNKKITTPAPPVAPTKMSAKQTDRKRDIGSSASTKAQSKKRQAIVSLPVRVTMGVAAVILIAVAGVLLANMTAIDTYNQATASLNASLEYAKKPNADPQQLKAQLDQANAQFDEARRLGALLAPNTKELINTNSDISDKITSSTKRKIAKANGNGSAGKANGQGSQSSNNGQDNGQNQGLTDEQRKQVEDTLKANQPNGPVNGDKNAQTKNDTDTNVKPW